MIEIVSIILCCKKNTRSLTLLLLLLLSQNGSHSSSLPSNVVRYNSSFNKVQPLTLLSDEELSLQASVKKLCTDVIEPRVKEMDTNSEVPKLVIDELFKAGVSWR